MKAAEYVALARKAAPEIRRRVAIAGDDSWIGWTFVVYDDGHVIGFHPNMQIERAVLSVTLTPENTASEDALVRALLASAITVIAHDGGSEAFLCGERATGLYDHVARDALLDALLADEDGRGRLTRNPILAAFEASPRARAARRASSVRAARPCENCQRCKGDHRRVLGLRLCPVQLARRLTADPAIALAAVVYSPPRSKEL